MMAPGCRLWFYAVDWGIRIRRVFCQGTRIAVGAHGYGVSHLRWWGEASGLKIGTFCSIARGVTIFLGGNPRTDWITTFPFNARQPWRKIAHSKGHPWSRGDVNIGNDVWLGEGCTFLPGVNMGDGGVVAAHAVISRDVSATPSLPVTPRASCAIASNRTRLRICSKFAGGIGTIQ